MKFPKNVLPCMSEWVERNAPPPPPQKAKPEKKPVVRTPATELEKRAIAAISPGRVTYCPGIGTKRFSRDMQGRSELTDRQRLYIWKTVWGFRRQIGDAELVAEASRIVRENQGAA